MRISKIDGLKTYSVQLNSVTHDAVMYEAALAYNNPSVTKWVDYGIRIMADMPYKGFILSGTIGMKRSFNYQYTQPSNATGLGLSNPNDLDSYLFKLGICF
jgi:hypothetical protein